MKDNDSPGGLPMQIGHELDELIGSLGKTVDKDVMKVLIKTKGDVRKAELDTFTAFIRGASQVAVEMSKVWQKSLGLEVAREKTSQLYISRDQELAKIHSNLQKARLKFETEMQHGNDLRRTMDETLHTVHTWLRYSSSLLDRVVHDGTMQGKQDLDTVLRLNQQIVDLTVSLHRMMSKR